MATSTTVKLDTAIKGAYSVPLITQAAAERAAEVLQRDFDTHHIYFNEMRFHDHITHGVLTLYSIGANPEQLQKHYDANSSYQRSVVKNDSTPVRDLQDPVVFKKHLSDERYYRDYVAYFQASIDKKGWQQTILDEIFKGDERANDMLGRFQAGLLHPLIHTGFGVEFEQPLIMAEGLALTCVEDPDLNSYLFGAEKAAKNKHPESLLAILEQIRSSEKLRSSVDSGDMLVLPGRILERVHDEMVDIVASYQVDPLKLEAHVAEMVNFIAYMTAGAQRSDKKVKFDFFLIHLLNCSVFLQHLLLSPRSSWLPQAAKARLLEWKVRTDLLQYISCGIPDLHISEIESYSPENPSDGWAEIFARANAVPEDDGHLSKLLRAIAAGEKLCEKYPESGVIKGADTWLKLAHMAIDSTAPYVHIFGTDYNGEEEWIRGAGFDRAWAAIPPRPKSAL